MLSKKGLGLCELTIIDYLITNVKCFQTSLKKESNYTLFPNYTLFKYFRKFYSFIFFFLNKSS